MMYNLDISLKLQFVKPLGTSVPPVNWILRTGFWEDSGLWYDTETWKDN